MINNLRFDGSNYNRKTDDLRLTGQLFDIKLLMADRKWRTLKKIAKATKHPEASISAQLRHLRKVKFGAWEVQKRHIKYGIFEYRVLGRSIGKVS